MKNYANILFLVFLSKFILFSIKDANGQDIGSIISEVDIDSLTNTVRELIGEDSVIVEGKKVLISTRKDSHGNDLAADYLVERLNRYNLDVTDLQYSSTGRDIIAKQTGTTSQNGTYIFCAHYDAALTTPGNISYGADDNASGVASVIEAARILSTKCFENNILYILWDEEELGFYGSTYYAQNANLDGEEFLGVINMDMIAYDRDSDMVFDINSNDDPS